MKNLPVKITNLKNTLNSPESWLILLDITLNNQENTLIRLVRNTEDVIIGQHPNIVGHWTMDDDSAQTTVVDNSLQDNDGTSVNNVVSATGLATNTSTSINFNGTTDLVTIPDIPAYDFTTEMSAFAWIKPDTFSKNGIISKYLVAGDNREWGLYLSNVLGGDAFLLVLLGISGGSDVSIQKSDSRILVEGNTYHVGFTYKAGTVTLYVNGSVIASNLTINIHPTTLENKTTDIEIGNLDAIGIFDGDIDDVRLYNKVLSQDEITSLYNNGDGEFITTSQESIVYTAFNFELDMNKKMQSGEIPTLKLRISNQERTLAAYLEELNGMVGSSVKITIINSTNPNLDYAELEETWDVIQTNVTESFVDFQLSLPNLLRIRYPLNIFISNHCNFTYKEVECAAVSPFETCKRTLDDCRLRNNTDRFGGFIGLSESGVHVV